MTGRERHHHGGRKEMEGGFTLVETMAALLLFGIGLLGIMAMQVVATRGNKDAHDLTVATSMAEWWMERLRTESLMWNRDSNDFTLANTPMFFTFGAGVNTQGNSTGWISPPGNPRYDKWLRKAMAATQPGEFCAQYCLTTLIPNELLRTEVRVMWWRNPANRDPNWASCPTGMTDGAGNPIMTRVRNVTITSALWRHDFM